MNRSKKRYLLIGLVASLVLVAGVAAYTVLTITSTVNVNEPLSISGVSITDTSSNGAGTCSISGQAATCTLSIYAGESGAISFIISNAASVKITPSVTATSSDSLNVPVSMSHIQDIAAKGTESITISFSASQSTPPESVTITASVAR